MQKRSIDTEKTNIFLWEKKAPGLLKGEDPDLFIENKTKKSNMKLIYAKRPWIT